MALKAVLTTKAVLCRFHFSKRCTLGLKGPILLSPRSQAHSSEHPSICTAGPLCLLVGISSGDLPR